MAVVRPSELIFNFMHCSDQWPWSVAPSLLTHAMAPASFLGDKHYAYGQWIQYNFNTAAQFSFGHAQAVILEGQGWFCIWYQLGSHFISIDIVWGVILFQLIPSGESISWYHLYLMTGYVALEGGGKGPQFDTTSENVATPIELSRGEDWLIVYDLYHHLNAHFLPRLIRGIDGCFPTAQGRQLTLSSSCLSMRISKF